MPPLLRRLLSAARAVRLRPRSTSISAPLPALAGLCVLWLIAFWAAPTQARTREIAPGERVVLGKDEGLLLVAVDTDVVLTLLRIETQRGLGQLYIPRAAAIGRSYRLYAIDAGSYRLAEIKRVGDPQRMRRNQIRMHVLDGAFDFEVKPGVINYPGDLIFRGQGVRTGGLYVANRGLPAMDWLQAEHPALAAGHRFEYRGRYADPFPEHYRQAVAASGLGGDGPPQDLTRAPPPSGELPLPIDELWAPSPLKVVELSPDGRLLGEVVTFKKEGHTHWGLNLIDLQAQSVVRLFEAARPIWRLDWVSERDLLLSIGHEDELDVLMAFNVLDGPSGRQYRQVVVPRRGLLVSTLRDEPGRILVVTHESAEPMVHKLDMRSPEALDASRFSRRERLDRGVDGVMSWYADGAGRLRLAVARNQDGDRVLMHGADGEYRQILNLDDEDSDFEPRMLSADGSRIYGFAQEGRAQRDLVEFDVARGEVVRTVFSQPGVDVVAPLSDGQGNLVGASYYRDGLLFSHYFDDRNAAMIERLRRAFPDKAATIMQRDRSGRHFLVAVGGSDKPTVIYHFDAQASQASPVSQTRPALEKYRFVPAQTLRAKSSDGFEIEAYLTLPPGTGKRPLVVFPHGGPIGVRDSRYFDPEVQFLASLGYAVLQVNFRGSEGFGTAFREAASGEYGAGIEDDIDAALKAALAAYPLDERRMCMLGASYGGYSTMISAIRWPGRFRCAVSLSGVSDRVLFFTASDSARDEDTRKLMEARIGNPLTEMERMLENSPLYRVADLQVPVMLVHGTEDLRVDYEHTRRLVRMLNLAGRPPVLVTLEGAGHGLDKDEDIQRTWSGIAGFLQKHLDGDVAEAAPGASANAANTANN
mgnify:CR=1 FL=1